MKKLLLLSCVIILFSSCSYRLTNPFLQTNLNINTKLKAEKEMDIDLVLNSLNNLGGTFYDHFYSVIESGDYYIAVGSSYSDLSGLPGGSDNSGDMDFVIAKINKTNLSLVNINNLGGTDSDTFRSVIESGDYYITVGISHSDLSGLPGGGPTSMHDFVIAKFNKSDLSLVNINNPGGPGTEGFRSVIESGDYYIAVGESYTDLSSLPGGSISAGGSDFVIAKFNKSNLSLVNINNPGGTENESLHSVIESDDYYIATGFSSSDLSDFTGGSNNIGSGDFVIAKFNKSNLSLKNINNLGGTNIETFKSIIESGDYYIAAGHSQSDLSGISGGSDNSGDYDFVIAKFNKSDLSLVNINNMGGMSYDNFWSVIESDDGYIAAGYSQSDLSGLPGGNGNAGSTDFVIAKFNKSDLSLVNINNPGAISSDCFYSVIKSGSHYIAAGYTTSDLSVFPGGSASETSDFVIAKFGN